MRTRRLIITVAVAAVLASAAFSVSHLLPDVAGVLAYAQESGKAKAARDQLASVTDLSEVFRQVVKSTRPSVVSISAVRKVRPGGFERPGMPEELRNFFGDDLMRRFFQHRAPERGYAQRGLGTGVIVSEDGHILTNHHVVRGSDKVTVTLSDNRTFQARVVGSDEKTDLAVLEIEARSLLAAPFGDSDKTEVGDWVLAIGNPFGLSMTVTAGIVSAKGRSGVGVAEYEDFLQTDAAINPGNSGGPLVDMQGRVVGINTAIATRTGSNAGIGFAIPINMASRVMDQIIANGRVERGRLGVVVQNLDKAMAKSFGYDSTRGALVGDVVSGGPAAQAGIQAGDIITRFDDKRIGDSNQLRNLVAATRPGRKVDVELVRDGQRRTLQVEVGRLGHSSDPAGETAGGAKNDLGVATAPLTPDVRRRLGYDDSQGGVLVTGVEAGSLAQMVGLRKDDIIVAVGKRRVNRPAELAERVTSSRLADGVRLTVKRGPYQRYLFVQSQR